MAEATEVFLATMFSGAGHATKHSGFLIAASADGKTFRNIRGSTQSIYSPSTGVRDPILLFWHGEWQLVYSYGPNVSPVLFLARSPDLLNWSPVVTLRLAPDRGEGHSEDSWHRPGTVNHFIDVPQWTVDPEGRVHIIACVDDNHHWVEIHALNPDPATWGDAANWSAVTTMSDVEGRPLVQGNSFVALRNGTYFMAFNPLENGKYYFRTSSHLMTGWSAPRQLKLDESLENGDSENLVCLPDGSLRFYISAGNSLKNVIRYVDSSNLGVDWSSPQAVKFDGFGPEPINWAQFVRITDPAAIAGMIVNRARI